MKTCKHTIGFVVVFVLLLIVSPIKAQQTTEQMPPEPIHNPYYKLEIGLRILPTFASFNLKTANGTAAANESSHAYGYGVSLGYNFSNHAALGCDVIYNTYSKEYMDNNMKREVNIKYINVPVLFSLSTNKSIPVNFNIVVGPQAGFNAGSSTHITRGAESDSLRGILSMKSVNFAIAYGAGLDFAFSKSHRIHAGIGFRGTYGLTKMNDNEQTTSPGSYYILDNTSIKTYSGYASLTFAL